jgi:riboflavin synthase
MFTGIIERSVRVIGVAQGPAFQRITLFNPWEDVIGGESIAVNGVCLTVAELSAGEVGFDVVGETLRRTNLGLIKAGEPVHVERSLRVGDRLSGHFVQGHVDGTAPLVEQGGAGRDEWRMVLEVPPELAMYLTPKGSVTLDGVSLTIAAVLGNRFEVALIPTTLQVTELGRREVGWPFNFEADVLTKTVVNWLSRVGPFTLSPRAGVD